MVASDFDSISPKHQIQPGQSVNKNANSQSTFLPFHHSILTSKHRYKSNKQQSYPSTIHYSGIINNDKRINEIDTESCPLEHTLNHRFLDKLT